MRFMAMIRTAETGKPPERALEIAIGSFTAEMSAAGVIVETAGLLPSERGARLRVARGRVHVTDGPFTEAKEVIGGYAILQVGSVAEAIAYTRRFLQLHADVLGPAYEAECEVRQLAEPAVRAPAGVERMDEIASELEGITAEA
jgi:hypothetical protein